MQAKQIKIADLPPPIRAYVKQLEQDSQQLEYLLAGGDPGDNVYLIAQLSSSTLSHVSEQALEGNLQMKRSAQVMSHFFERIGKVAIYCEQRFIRS